MVCGKNTMSYQACFYSDSTLPPDIKEEFAVGDSWCSPTYLVIRCGETTSVYTDAWEPEDATFFRDLNWIAFELEKAYQQGLKDGSNKPSVL